MTKEELLQKLTLVAMDHADITTLDKPIIGTHSLAPCLGILLYDEEKKMALVAHARSGNPIPAYKEEAKFYHTKEIIKKHFKEYIPFNEEEIPSTALIKNPNLEANEFYFDASTGKFVTSEALALLLEDSTITEEENKPKHR